MSLLTDLLERVQRLEARGASKPTTCTALSTGATAMQLGTYTSVQVTPNADATLTSTVPAAGQVRHIKVLTSGGTSYTLTFGSGFKSQGTLGTGTDTGKVFLLAFHSDGTTLNEVSRTAVM